MVGSALGSVVGIRLRFSRPLWQCVATLVILGLGVGFGRVGLTPFLTAQAARKVASEALLAYDSDDPRVNALLAARYHLGFADSDPGQAWAYYRAALRRAPLSPRFWLGLAQLYDGAGNREAARRALEMALWGAGPSPAVRWDAANLHLVWGELESALAHLRFVYEVDPARRGEVLALGRLLLPPQEIAGRLIPEHPEALREYFGVLLTQGELREARVVWDRLAAMGEADLALSRHYTEVLIQEGAFEEAMPIWKRYHGGEPLVWNGGFEKELVGWGFGWRVRSHSGVEVTLDPTVAYAGRRSLRVHLSGMPASRDVVPAEQLVPVTPGGAYRLSVEGKTRELFTRSGLVIEVLDGAAGQTLGNAQPLTGTGDWTSLEVNFRVPAEVHGVRLRLRRRPSDVWELPVYGTAWIDEVSLRPAVMADGWAVGQQLRGAVAR